MDRRWAAGGVLKQAFFALCALPLLAASSATGSALRELRWTDRDLAQAALTSRPRECLVLPDDPVQRAQIELGRAAFRTPLLLGGQAARLGLSCASCHVNGRDNPAFRFPGLSDRPGTADVTASLMSSHRGDDSFDPRPIPDLGAPGKVSRAAGDPALGRFIHELIVEEFDGREPPAAVLNGLASYVRAIDPARCPTNAAPDSGPADEADTAVRAVAAARGRLAADDPDSARLMLGAARTALGRLDERYAHVPSIRARLARGDTALRDLQGALGGDKAHADAAMKRWIGQARHLPPLLARYHSTSLYDPRTLARALARSGHGG